MNKYTATQLNKETNTVLNDATVGEVEIDHDKRKQTFVLMTRGRYQELLVELSRLSGLERVFKRDKREGKDEV